MEHCSYPWGIARIPSIYPWGILPGQSDEHEHPNTGTGTSLTGTGSCRLTRVSVTQYCTHYRTRCGEYSTASCMVTILRGEYAYCIMYDFNHTVP